MKRHSTFVTKSRAVLRATQRELKFDEAELAGRAAMKCCPLLLAVFMTLTAPASYAARPLITDDARTVDAKACQVETWVRSNHGSREYWALPACNFTGNLEITFGGARTSDATGTHTTDVVLQGKTLFKTLTPNGWSAGLAVGAIRHPGSLGDGKRVGELYSYVPASFSYLNDKVLMHTNVGVLHNTVTSSTRGTWGVGTEIAVTERTWLIAETFKQSESRPFFQAGVRLWIVPERLQIDATYGNRFGSSTDERWFSIGLRLLSPAFLP